MADTQLAGTGWGGEFWLDNDAVTPVLTELKQVKSFTLPQDEVEQVEITHLKSPNRRREYAPGMIEGGEFEVTLNFRAGSDTDQLLADALTDGSTRNFKAVIPERGVAAWEIEGEAIVVGYDRGEVTPDDPMEATVTLKITGATTEGAPA
ncbi:MAG TPA: phage tail tube protein [Sphingomicrobium sp.]|nr:phage tail tube protein [Sphingomicrobium sp.]